MDVKIENKDTLLGCGGELFYIDSLDELSQRVMIACSVRKGSFPYDRELGCYSNTVDKSDDRLTQKLSMIFKEASIDIPYTDLSVESVTETENGLVAKIEIASGADIVTTEVIINEQL